VEIRGKKHRTTSPQNVIDKQYQKILLYQINTRVCQNKGRKNKKRQSFVEKFQLAKHL